MRLSHSNILAVFFSANSAELLEGMNWYENASRVCFAIAQQHEVDTSTVVGVLSALSPNNRWSRNVSDTEALVSAFVKGDDTDAVRVSTYGKNKAKAISILQGEIPLAVLGGLKVRAFYQCIMGNNDAVCVDGHAYSIWAGERVTTTKTPSISEKLYNAIADDYRAAAEQITNILGAPYSAAQVQAVTWVVWRNHFGGKRK